MTERTVTVPTETEETITICDQCGLSDDAGEIIRYTPFNGNPDYDDIHLHRDCLEQMGVGVPDVIDTFDRAFEEESVIDDSPVLAFSSLALSFSVAGLVLTGFGLYTHSLDFMFTGALVLTFGIVGGFHETVEAELHLKRNND